MKKKFQIFISLPNSLRVTSKRILKSMNLRLENFFSVNFKNFSFGRMKNPKSFLISNRGRRTKFHYGFNDLGARSRKSLNLPKHADSSIPPLRSASMILRFLLVTDLGGSMLKIKLGTSGSKIEIPIMKNVRDYQCEQLLIYDHDDLTNLHIEINFLKEIIF